MKKLLNDYLKRIIINLIIFFILILSCVYYKAIAIESEHLVVDAAISSSAENKIHSEFVNSKENMTYDIGNEERTISYNETEKRINDHTALYDNDVDGDVSGNRKSGLIKAQRNGRLIRLYEAGYFLKGNSSYNFQKRPDGTYASYVANGEYDGYSGIDGQEGAIETSDYVAKSYNFDKAEEYIIAHYGDNSLDSDTISKALWYYRSKLTDSGDGQHHYDDSAYNDTSAGEEAIRLAKAAKAYKETSQGSIAAFDVEWKNVGNVTVNYDAEDSENGFYVVGPFALKYNDSVNVDNATLELYTNKDVDGIDLKSKLQDRFGIIHCNSSGEIVSGYDELNRDFPDSEEIFYIKLEHTDEDAKNIEDENFLAVPRVISNIKVKVRKEVPKVEAVYYENMGVSQRYKVNSSNDGTGTWYTLEEIPGVLPTDNWSPIIFVKSAQMIYQEKEVNKYLDIKTGKIIINSNISTRNTFTESELKANNQVTYKIKVSGNILEKGGSVESYKEETLQVPLSGNVISRDYAWIGNKKPKVSITAELKSEKEVQNYNMCFDENDESAEGRDYKVFVENTLLGNEEEVPLKAEWTLGGETKGEFNKYYLKDEYELENGILKFNYYYYAKDDTSKISTKYEDKESIYSYGKINIDNIVKHDDSLDDTEYSLEGKPQAYLLTITPGEDSGFYYGNSERIFDVYKKVVVVEGRSSNETSLNKEVLNNNNGVTLGNVFESEEIRWSKSENPPTYTVERLDNILENDEDAFVSKYIDKYCLSDEEGYLDILTNMVNGENYNKLTEDERIAIARATYRAILNEEETVNTSGTLVAIDREDDGGKIVENGKINVKFVTEHRKVSGEIVIEKIIEKTDDTDPIMGMISNTAQRTEVFDELKDYLTFEFEIGIGTTVQTITLDKNYREPIITNVAGHEEVDGYKWVWKSGQKEWLDGNDLNYTIKENLNADSTIFSHIEEPLNDAYEIRANIATGSFQDFIAKSQNEGLQEPIKFYSNFVYEVGAMQVLENISQYGSSGQMDINKASPIGILEDDKSNVRKLLAGSDVLFNIEVSGMYSYADSGFGNNNFRIINKNKKYIDLNIEDNPADEFSISLDGCDEESLRKGIFGSDDGKTEEFVWIKGIPPTYTIEQDTQKIIELEVQKQESGMASFEKDVNMLRDLVSWQTIGTRTGEMVGSVSTSRNVNDSSYMKFEFTNDVPTIDRNYKTGRLFIKQYAYGSEDYLKEVQKGFEFTYSVDVKAKPFKENTAVKGDKEKDNSGITLLHIDELKIKAQVADDGNYVWEWTGPEITWDTEWLDTPIYNITIDATKMPKGMTHDQTESVFRDLIDGSISNSGNVLSGYTITGKLSEVGKNENTKEPTESVKVERNLSVDERPETTDVFFYASCGTQKKSKIKLIQSVESRDMLEAIDNKADAIVIAIQSEKPFVYNNVSYDEGKTYYLTQNKDLTEKKSDAIIQLEIDDSLVNTFESNYISWEGESPKFWIEGNAHDGRSIFPNPKNYGEAQSIESPIGVITIEDTLFRDDNRQSNKTNIVIRAKDSSDTNVGHDFDVTLDSEYKEKLGLFFKLHIDNRADTYVKATYKKDSEGSYWEYRSSDICFGSNEKVGYTILPVKTSSNVKVFDSSGNGAGGKLQGGELKAEFTASAEEVKKLSKARFHVVALRDDDTEDSNPINFKLYFKKPSTDEVDGSKQDTVNREYYFEVKDTLRISKNHKSVEWYSDYLCISGNDICPYVIQAEKLGNKYPNYWKTDSGDISESDNKELINIVLDYRTNNNIRDDGSLIKSEEVELKLNRTLNGDFSNDFIKYKFKSSGSSILTKSYMKADVYIQGYGTKKMVLYSKGTNPKGGVIDNKSNTDYMTWQNKTITISNSGFEFAGESKYIKIKEETGLSGLLSYSIIDYELPLGFVYESSNDNYKFGTTNSAVIPRDGEQTTRLKYKSDSPLNSRILAVQNKFTDCNIRGTSLEYTAEVSGTFTYFVGKEEHKVTNGMQEFHAIVHDDGEIGIFGVEDENGSIKKVYFVWNYDSLPPRYNITLDYGATNIGFENASGYMNENGMTYAVARNECKKTGGYVGVTIDAENNGIVPNRKFNFIVEVWRKGKDRGNDTFNREIIDQFVGEIDYRNNKDIWISPRITWAENTKVYYRVIPINSELYTTKVILGGNEGSENSPIFNDKNGNSIKYFTLEENSYDDFVYEAYQNGVDANQFTTISYETELESSTIELKNVRIHAQNPDEKNNYNQEFEIITKLDGYCVVKGSSGEKRLEPGMEYKEILKSQSNDSASNPGMDGVTIEVKHFPDDYIKVSVDEELIDGVKTEYWTNTNISNTGNFLDGNTEIFVTNQYNEFKQIDLTTSLGGKITLKDMDGNPVANEVIDVEVYAQKYDLNNGGNYAEIASVDKFGVVQTQPVRPRKKDGNWSMDGVLIPQLYANKDNEIVEIFYLYDGQKYNAIDNRVSEDYAYNSTADRLKEAEESKVVESNYKRDEFNSGFTNIYGKRPENIEKKSIAEFDSSTPLRKKKVEVIYEGEDGAPAESRIVNRNENRLKNDFTIEASTIVLSDETNRIIDDQDDGTPIDYGDEDTYEFILGYPFDRLFYNKSSDKDNVIKFNSGNNEKTFISKKYLEQINLDIEEREDVDVSVENTLENVRITSNGNKIEPEIKKEIKISPTDYYYRADVYKQNDKYGFLVNSYKGLDKNEMEIYLTFKYTISNESEEYALKISELENYVTDSLEVVTDNVEYYQANHHVEEGDTYDPNRKFLIAGPEYLKETYTGDYHYSDEFSPSTIPDYKTSDDVTYNKISLDLTNGGNSEGLIVDAESEESIYIDFRVRKKTISEIHDSLDILDEKPIKNIIEIGNYITVDSDDNSKIVGKISNNFAPDNLNLAQCHSEYRYESDTASIEVDGGDQIVFTFDTGNEYQMEGIVVEKSKNGSQSAAIGGMTVQMLERMYLKDYEVDSEYPTDASKYVPVVDVDLKEADNRKAYNFLWATDRPLSVYGGRSFSETCENAGLGSNVVYRSTVETEMDGTGIYRFNNIPYGDFIVRVLYGLDKGTLDNTCGTTGDPVALNESDGSYYSKDTNGGEILTANFDKDITGTTPAVYNGQDYKSAYTEELSYGDDEARRLESMAHDMTFTNDNTRELARLNDKSAIHQDMYNKYYMYMDSTKEFTRNNEEDNSNKMDFALSERPENMLYLDQQIESIKVITNDGREIFDAEYAISYIRVNDGDSPPEHAYKMRDFDGYAIYASRFLDSQKSVGIDQMQELYKEENKDTSENPLYGTGEMNFKYINMDETILQGTTIEINYKISAINLGDEDYISKKIYNPNGGSAIDNILNNANGSIDTKDFDKFTNQKKIRDLAMKLKNERASQYGTGTTSGEYYELGKYVGKYYYNNIPGEDVAPVQTRVRQVLNYMDNSAVFMTEYNGRDNRYWRTSSAAELNGNGIQKNRIVEQGTIDVYKVLDKDENAYMTEERNNIAISVDELNSISGEASNKEFEGLTIPWQMHYSNSDNEENIPCIKSINLIARKTVASTSDADDMSFETLSEIVKYENTAGRRDVSILIGDANPSKGEFKESLDKRDASSTEIVTFMPPTGLKKAKLSKMPIIMMSIIIALGIGCIYVLRRKKNIKEEEKSENTRT